MPSTSSSSAAVTPPRRLNRSGRKVPISSSSSSSSLAGVVAVVVMTTTLLLLLGASNDDGHRHHAGLPSFVGVVVVDAYRGPVVSPTKRRTWWFKTSPSYADHEYEYDSHGKHHHNNNNAFARATTGPAADSAAAVLGGGGSGGSIVSPRPMVADEYRQVMEALPSPLMDATGHLIDSPQALAQLVSSQRVALYFAGSPCSRGLTMAAAGSYNHHQDNDHEDDDDENDHDNDGRYFARHHRRGQDLDDLDDDDLDDSSCCVLVDPSTTVDEVEFMLPQYREALQQTNQAVQLIYVPSCDDTVETQLERMQELGLELGVPIGPASDALKKKFAIWSAAEVARLYGNNNNGNVNGNVNDNDNDVDSRMATSTSTTQSTTATPWGRQHNDSIDQQQRRAGDLPARRSGVPAFVVLNTDGEELAFLNTKRHSIQALGEWPLDDPKGIW